MLHSITCPCPDCEENREKVRKDEMIKKIFQRMGKILILFQKNWKRLITKILLN